MNWNEDLTNNLYTYRARLNRVIDGDTCYLDIDLGMRIFTTISLRIAGVNAPEIRGAEREDGLVSRDAAIDWFSKGSDSAWPLIVVTEKDSKSFDRYVGHIYKNGESLAKYLLDEGFAVPHE